MGKFYKSKRILIIKTKNIMEAAILSMAIFAFICTILNLIDSFKTRRKINEIISKHNLLVKLLVCDLQKIEKEVENLKNQTK